MQLMQLMQLMQPWGCSFPAGRGRARLTPERLQPPKGLCVPSSSHSSALTPCTHLRDLSRVQGGLPGVGNQGRALDHCPFPQHSSASTRHVLSVNCPEENPALGTAVQWNQHKNPQICGHVTSPGSCLPSKTSLCSRFCARMLCKLPELLL